MKLTVSLGLLLVFLAGCGDAREFASSVQLDGSSTVFPISVAVAEKFLAVRPEIRVTVGISGTGGGFKKLANGEIDINNASRPINASERLALAKAHIEFLELPIAYDGLSVVVNPNNDWVDFLTIDELQRIWQPDSLVKTWRDVRFEWPDKPIRLYGPGVDSGTFDHFTKVVNGESQRSRADFSASEDDNLLVQGIAGDQYALGYFGHVYFFENSDSVRLVPVDAGFGPVSPSVSSITSGDYKRLARPV
ncbi:MAG: phosphate transport system substrate-binding protein, partial [Sulfitobacter sp.]